MGAVAPLSVLLVGLVGMVIVAVTVVRIALLERKAFLTGPTPVTPVSAGSEAWTLPGTAAA